jgi:hypothetical protein
VQYIKILPLATFGANFNYSIWYVEVRGIKDEQLMRRVDEAFQQVSILYIVYFFL